MIKRITPIRTADGPEIKPTKISGQCCILKSAPAVNNKTPEIIKKNEAILMIFIFNKLKFCVRYIKCKLFINILVYAFWNDSDSNPFSPPIALLTDPSSTVSGRAPGYDTIFVITMCQGFITIAVQGDSYQIIGCLNSLISSQYKLQIL